MQIDEKDGSVIFDHLVDVRRELGSEETISMPKPAVKAVASNAKGVFEDKSLTDINKNAVACGTKVRETLSAK